MYYNTVYNDTTYNSIDSFIKWEEVMNMSRIYFEIESVLKEKNISKNQLCIHCNLQRTQLNNYCKNKTGGITLEVLKRMCDFLGCTPNDLLKYEK